MEAKRFTDLITFTRSTAGGRFNAAGAFEMVPANQPRFDYDPATKLARGILIEEARSNLFQQSAALENVYWNRVNTNITVSATPAPDPTSFMRTITATATSSASMTRALGTILGAHTISFFVKAGTVGTCSLRFFDTIGEAARATFNLTTGAVVNSAGPVLLGRTATHVGDGIWRLTLTADYSTRSSAGLAVYLYVNSYIGATSGETILAWGGQLEGGAFATSYIPTTTAQVTRSGDNALINNLSPWFRQSAGTIFVDFTLGPIGVGSVANAVYFSSATSSQNRVVIRHGLGGGNIYGVTTDGSGVAQSEVAGAAGVVVGANVRAALATVQNDVAMSVNGGTVVKDNSTTQPTPNRLGIGAATSGATQYANGWIRKVRYFPRRLSDTELRAQTA